MSTPEEDELQEAARTAANTKSTNPWGPVKSVLRSHADARTAGVIGIQDSTVIRRAIGSPNMKTTHPVHGFVIMLPEWRQPADLDEVVASVREAIEIEPWITTAILMPYTTDFRPSHVLSAGAPEGIALAALYPGAVADLAIVKRSTAQDVVMARGPWKVTPQSLERGDDGSTVLRIDDPDAGLRSLYPGDGLLIVEQGDEERPIAVGRLHHLRPSDGEAMLLVLDRFAELPAAADPTLLPVEDASASDADVVEEE